MRLRTRTWFILTAVAVAALATGDVDAQPDSPTRFRDPGVMRAKRRMPVVNRLAWRDRINLHDYVGLGTALAVGDGRVYYVKGGSVVAADPRTGKQLWQSGRLLLPTLAYRGGRVLAADRSGTVHAFDRHNGASVWSSQTGMRDIDRLQPTGDTLLVNSYKDGLTTLSLRDGRFRWRAKEKYSGDPRGWAASNGPAVVVNDVNVLVASFTESGAITVTAFYGFDLGTGRRLWRLKGDGRLVAAKDNLLYFRDAWLHADLQDHLEINVVHARTGHVLRSHTYVVKSPDPSVLPRYRTVILRGKDLFLDMKFAVYQLPLGDTGASPVVYRSPVAPRTPPKPSSFHRLKESHWVAGPYGGKLFFSDGGGLYAVHLSGRRVLTYQGVDNEISRLEITGNRILVGQLNGWVTVLDLGTGKTLLRTNTGARVFGSSSSSRACCWLRPKTSC